MAAWGTGDAPPARKYHTATAATYGEIVIFGGQSLESSSDLNDLYFLIQVCLQTRLAIPDIAITLDAGLSHQAYAGAVQLPANVTVGIAA